MNMAQNCIKLQKTARIAIIGGGVSGLSAAKTLVTNGFNNVIVFEGGLNIVPLQHTVNTECNVYDMDLIYIPALSWTGAGIETEFQNLLQECNTELIPVSEFEHFSMNDDWKQDPDTQYISLPNGTSIPKLNEYANSKFPPQVTKEWYDEIVRFFALCQPYFVKHQYSGVHRCMQEKFTLPNETFDSWIKRHNFPLTMSSIVRILALYGNTSIREAPACQILMMLANKLPSILGPILALLSRQEGFAALVRETPLNDILVKWLELIGQNTPNFMRRVKRGYSQVFTDIAIKYRIDYRTNLRVQTIITDVDSSQKIRLIFQNDDMKSEEFDNVIIAGRPDQVCDILPDHLQMKRLFAEVKCNVEAYTESHGVYGVAIVAYKNDLAKLQLNGSDTGVLGNNRFIIDHHAHLKYIQKDLLNYDFNLMRFLRSTDEDVLHVTFQTRKPFVKSEKEKSELFTVLQQYGFSDLKVLNLEHYPNTPTKVPVNSVERGWYEKAVAAQGQSNVLFIGEVFFGHGVPTTWLGTQRLCEQWIE